MIQIFIYTAGINDRMMTWKEGSYMFNLSQTTFYSIICALLPCIIYMIVQRRKNGKVQNVCIFLFALYVWQVYDVTGIGTLGDIIYVPEGSINYSIFKGTINLNPFSGLDFSFVLNIIMCIPFGFLVPFIWKSYRSIYKTALLGAGFSLLIEISQLFTTRATDIDDLIANTCGAFLGYMIWKLFVWIFGIHLKQPVCGKSEVIIYIGLSFLGMFFLYHPFWFAFQVAPLIWG